MSRRPATDPMHRSVPVTRTLRAPPRDFRNFGRNVAALRAEVEAVDREICSRPADSVLALADLSGTVTSVEVVWLFKHSAAATRGYVRKQAVVGLTV